jgi:hypothetical protein
MPAGTCFRSSLCLRLLHHRARDGLQAAQFSGLSTTTVGKYVQDFKRTGMITGEDPSNRGAGSDLHPNSLVARMHKYRDALRQSVDSVNLSELPDWVTRLSARDHIFSVTGDWLSVTHVGRLLTAALELGVAALEAIEQAEGEDDCDDLIAPDDS